MKKRIIAVSEKALREFVGEALDNKAFTGWSANAEGVTNVSPTVDPSAAATDPVNPSFTPQTKVEFSVALQQLVRNMADDKMPGLYDAVKQAIDHQDDAENEEKEMKKVAQQGNKKATKQVSGKHVEEALRRMVRNVLVEMNLVREAPEDDQDDDDDDGREGSLHDLLDKFDTEKEEPEITVPDELETPAEEEAEEEDDDVVSPVPTKPMSGSPRGTSTKAYKKDALGNMVDVGGASFDEIAKEMGMATSGAKRFVGKALEKAQFLSEMDPDDLEILTLTAMKNYITELNETGELTPADVQFLRDHPVALSELEGFREYLHSYIIRHQKLWYGDDSQDDQQGL